MSGIFTRVMQRERIAAPVERRAVEGAVIEAILSSAAYRSTAGVAVTPDSALTYSAVYACVRVLAETLGTLPLILYRKLPGGGKERAEDDYRYSLMHDAVNDEMTSTDWRETQMANMCLWGNCYSQIIGTNGGRITGLWPMLSRYMTIDRDRQGNLIYKTSEPGAKTPVLSAEQTLHVRMMSLNGILGMSPISLARQAIGLGMATEQFGASFFGNGANPGLVIEHPGTLSPEAYAHLQASTAERHEGPDNAHKTMILEEGMKIEKIGVPNNDAQFLETRRFQISEIARWFRIPPHMVGDLERSTFSNIEHQGLDFLIYTMRPWLTRWEQAQNRSLLLPRERNTLYFEFLVDSLLRIDIVTRYNAYATAIQWGYKSRNEVRVDENMNPVPGGDVLLTPLNMAPMGSQPQPATGKGAPASLQDVKGGGASSDLTNEADTQADRALYPVYREALERISRRAVADINAVAKRQIRSGSFGPSLGAVLEEVRGYAVKSLTPVAQAHAAMRRRALNGDVGEWAERYVGELRSWMVETAQTAQVAHIDPVEAVEDQLKHVDEQRINEWAQDIAQRVGGQNASD